MEQSSVAMHGAVDSSVQVEWCGMVCKTIRQHENILKLVKMFFSHVILKYSYCACSIMQSTFLLTHQRTDVKLHSSCFGTRHE